MYFFIARLDGISKPLRHSTQSMEDYLQLDEWKDPPAKPGQKRVSTVEELLIILNVWYLLYF